MNNGKATKKEIEQYKKEMYDEFRLKTSEIRKQATEEHKIVLDGIAGFKELIEATQKGYDSLESRMRSIESRMISLESKMDKNQLELLGKFDILDRKILKSEHQKSMNDWFDERLKFHDKLMKDHNWISK